MKSGITALSFRDQINIKLYSNINCILNTAVGWSDVKIVVRVFIFRFRLCHVDENAIGWYGLELNNGSFCKRVFFHV